MPTYLPCQLWCNWILKTNVNFWNVLSISRSTKNLYRYKISTWSIWSSITKRQTMFWPLWSFLLIFPSGNGAAVLCCHCHIFALNNALDLSIIHTEIHLTTQDHKYTFVFINVNWSQLFYKTVFFSLLQQHNLVTFIIFIEFFSRCVLFSYLKSSLIKVTYKKAIVGVFNVDI